MAIQPIILNNFKNLTLELEAFSSELSSLQNKITKLGESSSLAIQKYYNENLPHWQHKIEEMKVAFAKLPDDFKKIEFTQTLNKKLDQLNQQIGLLRQNIQGLDISQWPTKMADSLPDLSQLKASANQLCDSVRNFQLDPLIQKLINSGRELASKKDLQWGRKFFHTANGLIGLYFWAYSGLADWIVLSVLGAYFVYAVTTEIVRRKYPPYNQWMIKNIGWMMREHEKKSISSASYYISTMFFIMLVFPKNVSILTLFYIAVGDTIAGIVGVLWGKHKITAKVSFEGAFACFFVCALATWFFVTNGIPGLKLFGFDAFFFSICGGMIAAMAEGSLKKFDDNLVMPLLSAPLLMVLIWLFQ